MLTIYFARHGETTCSARGVLCGRSCNIELNAAGQSMAEALATHFGQRPWAAIYSSTQRRAHETAAAVAHVAGLEVRTDPRWCEIDYGAWDGQHDTVLLKSDPAFRTFRDDPTLIRPPGGESLLEVSERAMQALDAVRGRVPRGEVFVVTHKTLLRVLLCRLLGIDIRNYRRRLAAPVGSVTVVEFDDRGPRLLALGLSEHLS